MFEFPGGGREVLRAMKSLKPLIVLMFLFVSISGVCFWLCENLTTIWLGGTPKPFYPGLFSGFWWAFISMTTVGYVFTPIPYGGATCAPLPSLKPQKMVGFRLNARFVMSRV